MPEPSATAQGEVQEDWSSHGILGTCRVLLHEMDRVRKVAPTKLTILIVGPSGTGKENVARVAHKLRPRPRGPFVAVNCGALPANLLESELFGVTRGAFTSAVTRQGLVELAHGGTLFLDEIGEMPLEVQVKLLRFLQERRFRSVGGGVERKVDVRIVVATNKPIKKMVAEGTFREDLFYRIAQVPVFMPPLAERGEDVILLAEHFMEAMAATVEWEEPRLSRDAKDLLRGYDWPGNVRQLKNIIEQAVPLRINEKVVGYADIKEALDREDRLEGREPVSMAVADVPFDVRVVQLLGAGELTFKELRTAMKLGRQTARRRLQPLVDTGIIEDERRGTVLYFRLAVVEVNQGADGVVEQDEAVGEQSAETVAGEGDPFAEVLRELVSQPGGFAKGEFCVRTGMASRTAGRKLKAWCEDGTLASNGKGGAARRYHRR